MALYKYVHLLYLFYLKTELSAAAKLKDFSSVPMLSHNTV